MFSLVFCACCVIHQRHGKQDVITIFIRKQNGTDASKTRCAGKERPGRQPVRPMHSNCNALLFPESSNGKIKGGLYNLNNVKERI